MRCGMHRVKRQLFKYTTQKILFDLTLNFIHKVKIFRWGGGGCKLSSPSYGFVSLFYYERCLLLSFSDESEADNIKV